MAAISGTGAHIVCTRKTTPGLRAFEKDAVRSGGGFNHRFGLDDAVVIKDNHVAVAGGVRKAIERVRGSVGHLVKIEIEVDSLAQLEEALATGADAVLLDNMTVAQMADAVKRVNGRMLTEASGGVNLETVTAIAESGVAGFEVLNWYGITLPGGTPQTIVRALNQDLLKALATPAMVEAFNAQGNEVAGGTPAEFAAFIKSEMTKYAKVVKAANIPPE